MAKSVDHERCDASAAATVVEISEGVGLGASGGVGIVSGSGGAWVMSVGSAVSTFERAVGLVSVRSGDVRLFVLRLPCVVKKPVKLF